MMVFPFFVIFDPECLQTILGSKRHTNKSFFYKLLHNFLGEGLITSSGEKWASHRRYIQPTFHLSILEKFVETFADSAQCLTAKMNVLVDKPVNITSIVNECVLDILNGGFCTIIEFTSLPKNFRYLPN
jgi:cytochrome P450 family 4